MVQLHTWSCHAGRPPSSAHQFAYFVRAAPQTTRPVARCLGSRSANDTHTNTVRLWLVALYPFWVLAGEHSAHKPPPREFKKRFQVATCEQTSTLETPIYPVAQGTLPERIGPLFRVDHLYWGTRTYSEQEKHSLLHAEPRHGNSKPLVWTAWNV